LQTRLPARHRVSNPIAIGPADQQIFSRFGKEIGLYADENACSQYGTLVQYFAASGVDRNPKKTYHITHAT
jgi:hypothetical protein